jgi:hypothetical protein
MAFQQYKGTPFETSLLPIIPKDARLSPNSGILPDNIGKIPGLYYPHAGVWSGFAGWSKGSPPKRGKSMMARGRAGSVPPSTSG